MFGIPISRAYAQREALLHIVHPDTFEPIVSREHKQRFTRENASYLADTTTDVDRKLLDIRQNYLRQHGQPIDFYKRTTPATPPASSVLPRTLGARLRPYVELITHLPASNYSAEDIVTKLGQIHPPIAPELTYRPDPDALVRDLVNLLRLLKSTPSGYRRWTHLDDATVEHIMRYAALTLLVSKGVGNYDLPALRAPFDGESYSAEECHTASRC